MSRTARNSSSLNVQGVLADGLARLEAGRVPSAQLAAELLLMHLLGRDRAWLYAHPDAEVAREEAVRYFELVARRVSGVPIQYLTGRQEFWGLEFEVTPAVLIPRPESEHVIEVALERLGVGRRKNPLRLGDVGAGSGCLAIALAHELPMARVTATDISALALEVARRNAARHGVADRIEFVQTNLLDTIAQSSLATRDATILFDLIVSNPPYVGRREADLLPREVREHEPQEALFAGERGFDLYQPLIEQAGRLLGRGGILVLELGYNAAEQVQGLLEGPGWTNVAVTPDLAGIPRVIAAERA